LRKNKRLALRRRHPESRGGGLKFQGSRPSAFRGWEKKNTEQRKTAEDNFIKVLLEDLFQVSSETRGEGRPGGFTIQKQYSKSDANGTKRAHPARRRGYGVSTRSARRERSRVVLTNRQKKKGKQSRRVSKAVTNFEGKRRREKKGKHNAGTGHC